MPHPSQMGGFDDQSLGGCLINGILLVVCIVLFLAISGGHY